MRVKNKKCPSQIPTVQDEIRLLVVVSQLSKIKAYSELIHIFLYSLNRSKNKNQDWLLFLGSLIFVVERISLSAEQPPHFELLKLRTVTIVRLFLCFVFTLRSRYKC